MLVLDEAAFVDGTALVALPCGHRVAHDAIWQQTGCDVAGEDGVVACPSCARTHPFCIAEGEAPPPGQGR